MPDTGFRFLDRGNTIVKLACTVSLLVITFFTLPGNLRADDDLYVKSDPLLLQQVRRLEYRRGMWTAVRARLKLQFISAANQSGICEGDLLYNRISEKIFLKCFNQKKKLLFIFRTNENRFDLYLPDRSVLYQGNIFELSDSPELESHLKPLDLYRALKMTAIPYNQRIIWRHLPEGGSQIQLYSNKNGEAFLSREIYSTPADDVTREIYFSPDGKGQLDIKRSDFRRIEYKLFRQKEVFYFPVKIEMINHEKQLRTVFYFQEVSFPGNFTEKEWFLMAPQDTKIIRLDYNPMKAQTSS